MIIDSHQHFWALERGDYGWLAQAPELLQRDYLPGELAPCMAASGIARTVLVQAAPTIAETLYMLELAAAHPFIAGVVGWLDFEAATFADDLTALCRHPRLVGVRPLLHDLPDPHWLARPVVIDGLRRLADSERAFDIVCHATQLPVMADVLRQVPGLRVVLDHLGNPPIASGATEPWANDLARLAAIPGLMCKVSGLGTLAAPGWGPAEIAPFIDFAAAAFGPERLMWGSDWPVSLLGGSYPETLESVRAVLAPRLSAEELAGVMGSNAARFYRLPEL